MRDAGRRVTEAVTLTWDRVDWEGGVVRLALAHTKGKRGAALPVRVRCGTSSGLALTRAAMQLCGWRTPSMLERYHIVNEADLAAAVAKRAGEPNTISSNVASSV